MTEAPTRKSRAGVSPVVATILLIAITVVAVGTVAVFVMGLPPLKPSIVASLDIEGATKNSTVLVINHKSGASVTSAFTPSSSGAISVNDWTDMEVRVNGAKIVAKNVKLNGSTVSSGIIYDFIAGDVLEIELVTPAALHPGDVVKIMYRPATEELATAEVPPPTTTTTTTGTTTTGTTTTGTTTTGTTTTGTTTTTTTSGTTTTTTPPPNRPPVADISVPPTLKEDVSVVLDGTASYDPDGTITTYSWAVSEGTLTNDTTATPTLSVPDVSADTDVTIGLTVTDDDGATHSDTATMTVMNVVQVLTVDDDRVQCPTADYTTIQDALGYPGTWIRVYPGAYSGTVYVGEGQIIIAEQGPLVTTISGGTGSDPPVLLRGDRIIFDGFTVTGGFPSIKLEGTGRVEGSVLSSEVNGCVVKNCITVGGIGIMVRNADYCYFENDNCSGGGTCGMLVEEASVNNTIKGCTLSSNGASGVWVRNADSWRPNIDVEYNVIRNNTMNSNGECGVKLSVGAPNNTVNNNYFDGNAWAVFLDGALYGCDNNTIINNKCYNNGERGVWVRGGKVWSLGNIIVYSDHNRIENNIISGAGKAGITIGEPYGGEGNVVAGNDISGALGGLARGGIELADDNTPGTIIENNYIHGNLNGVRIMAGNANITGCRINHNNIEGNTAFGVYREVPTPGELDAINNWWGHASGPAPPGGSGSGDNVGEHITFNPYSSSKYTDIPH